MLIPGQFFVSPLNLGLRQIVKAEFATSATHV